jgi:effector-binding domain-containing protein
MEIGVRVVSERRLAAVRRRVTIGQVGSAWRAALDQVWAYLRSHPGLHTGGHNVFLYHHPEKREDPMDVDFGVEIVGPFDGEGEVKPVDTPGGEVVRAVHVGPYDRMKETHDAIHAWQASSGRQFAGKSWEIYGDWNDDPAKNEVEILYLLAPE